ncbi:MAG: amidase [Deltaproteobacteria bacterium]|nr:amidase [Deltaproteobacteria bacterium]
MASVGAGAALVACGGARTRGSGAPAPVDDWLVEATIDDLGKQMASGAKTSHAITAAYLARIAALDPQLHAVIETNPDALAIADALDAERKAGKVRGPLHGIPVLVKDNIDSADKMQTTAGSLAMVGAKPAQDSGVVAKLRAAGAVLLGKTNLSEWANIRSTRSTSGWSGRGGQTHNPYALDRNACGSSSGSGAATAANLCTVAVGSETDGSILCPSSVCNLVGIKPTVGLVSRAGIIPISHSQDTAGPMARTVRDAALLLGALAGSDPRDIATKDAKVANYLAGGDVKGMRIGVVRSYFGGHPEQDKLVDQAIAALKGRGVEVVDPVELPAWPSGDADPEFTVLLYELKADLNAYLATANAPVKSLADVIAFNQAHAAQEMPYFAQEIFEKAQAKGPLTDQAYLDARAKSLELARGGIDAALDKHKLDALVAPTAAPAWLNDLVLGDHIAGGSTQAAAVAGYPSVTVPVGFTRGLPVGMSIFGRAWTEATLIRIAAAVEDLLHARRPPSFAASADLAAATDCGHDCASR